jgi:hypothetical protein
MKKLILLTIILIFISSAFAGYYDPDQGPVVDYSNNSITLQLVKQRCINVSVMKRTVFDLAEIRDPDNTENYLIKLRDYATPLEETEGVFFYLERIKETPLEKDYFVVGQVNYTMQPELCFYPGKYKVSGTLIDTAETIIPKDMRTYCIGLGGESTLSKSDQLEKISTADKMDNTMGKLQSTLGYITMGASLGGVPGAIIGGVVALLGEWFEVCIGSEEKVGLPDEDVDYTPALMGGVELEEVSLSKNLLKHKEKSGEQLTFYVMAYEKPTIIEELAIIGSYGEVTKRADMKNVFMPR